MIENSEVMRKVLTTLINISARKATAGNVVSTMSSLIKKLETRYDFLKYVEIEDTRFLESIDPITVMSDVNSIPPAEMGNAIHAIVSLMNESLGRDAGFYFIKEVARNIGEDYHTTIMDNMGLNLMQMEWEVTRMEKKVDK